MNLRNVSDQVLLEKTENLVKQERELLTQVLHHLREIESRRLFSSLGFKSLFDYAVKKLGYSADQAARRISAMRLLKEIPELEEKIESGALIRDAERMFFLRAQLLLSSSTIECEYWRLVKPQSKPKYPFNLWLIKS